MTDLDEREVDKYFRNNCGYFGISSHDIPKLCKAVVTLIKDREGEAEKTIKLQRAVIAVWKSRDFMKENESLQAQLREAREELEHYKNLSYELGVGDLAQVKRELIEAVKRELIEALIEARNEIDRLLKTERAVMDLSHPNFKHLQEQIDKAKDRELELIKQRDEEAWYHAACLSIAEGHDWGGKVQPSEAMGAVRRLRDRLDEAKERERVATDALKMYVGVRSPRDDVKRADNALEKLRGEK